MFVLTLLLAALVIAFEIYAFVTLVVFFGMLVGLFIQDTSHDLWDIFCASVFSALLWPKALYLYIKPNTSV